MFARSVQLLVCSVAICLLRTSTAWAGCAAEASKLLWSYPADGQIDVPTNADLWLTGTALGAPRLNGRDLVANEFGGYDLGELSRHTTYSVTWATEPTPTSISFTTGEGPQLDAAEPSAPREPPIVERGPTGAAFCKLVPPQGCFDTGAPTRIRFDIGQPTVAFLIRKHDCDGTNKVLVWPASCGAPILDGEDPVACAEFALTDGVRVSPVTALYCSTPDTPSGITVATRSSCASDWPPANAVLASKPKASPTSATDADAGRPRPKSTTIPAAASCSIVPERRTSELQCARPWLVLLGLLLLRNRRSAKRGASL